MKLKVSAAQLPISADISQNTALIYRAIEQAAQEKADILLTPEGSLSGYTHEFDQGLLDAGLQEVTRLARQRKMGLALGTCFREADGQVYNQIRFYTPDGKYLGFHSKILRCKNMLEPGQTGEVDHFAEGKLRVLSFKGIPIGGLICNDLWANPAWTPMPDPHLTRQLKEMGARIIFHAVNGGRDGSSWSEVIWQYHEANLRLRARADRLWIATVDNCAPLDLPCSAPSGVINPAGEWVCRLPPKGEQFGTYDIVIRL
jgi:predicted amidohydrolase